jgi:hypothetical protein
MHYQTLFDISTAGYKEWEFALISALLVAANGVVLLFFRRATFRKPLHVGSAVVVFVSFCIPYWDHSRLLGAYRNHDYRVAEGKVENYWQREWYDRRRKQTNRQEGFTVGGVAFAYARGAEAGFTNHQDPRIAFRDGMTLRVCYVADPQLGSDEPVYRILKLETAEGPYRPLSAQSSVVNH